MRILVVDDDPDVHRSLRTALEAMGLAVYDAAAGHCAVRQIGQRACESALIDRQPGRESVPELLNALLQGQPQLVGVILAAHSGPGAATGTPHDALEGMADLATAPGIGPPDRLRRGSPMDSNADGPIQVGRRVSLDALEAEHIRRILESTASLEEAAAILNIDPSTLYRKRKRLGI